MNKRPMYDHILCWKLLDSTPCNKCFTNEEDSLAHAELIKGHVTNLYLYYPDGQCKNLSLRASS